MHHIISRDGNIQITFSSYTEGDYGNHSCDITDGSGQGFIK